MNEKVRAYLRRIWFWLSTASTLLTFGLAALVSTLVTAFVHLAWWWRVLLFASVLLIVVAVAQTPAAWLLATLRRRFPPSEPPAPALPPSPPPEPPEVTEARRVEAAKDRERRRVRRAAAHETLAVLEYHLADVVQYARAQNPEYRGEWLESRRLLAEDPSYDTAIHLTEQAFNSLTHYLGAAAKVPLVNAIREFRQALNRDRDPPA